MANDFIIEPDILRSAIEFWGKVYEADEILIKFIKKDKTERIMRATLNFDKIPVKDRPKKVDVKQILKLMQKSKIIHVYDLDKKAWRSIPFTGLVWMDIRKKRFYGPESRRYK